MTVDDPVIIREHDCRTNREIKPGVRSHDMRSQRTIQRDHMPAPKRAPCTFCLRQQSTCRTCSSTAPQYDGGRDQRSSSAGLLDPKVIQCRGVRVHASCSPMHHRRIIPHVAVQSSRKNDIEQAEAMVHKQWLLHRLPYRGGASMQRGQHDTSLQDHTRHRAR